MHSGSHYNQIKLPMLKILLSPISRFRTPLLYSGVSTDMVKERSLQLEVCMTQKRSHRSFLMAMVHMPLRTAVRRPIREKYPLIPCMNVTIPNNMRVYSAAHLQVESSKGNRSPINGRVASPVSDSPLTPKDDMELEDVVSLTGDEFLRSHLSLCLDDSDDDGLSGSNEGQLQEVHVANGVGSGGSSTTTLDMPSAEDEEEENDDDDEIPEVVTDGEGFSVRSTPIDMRFVEANPAPSSKKKIIPNELLKDVSQDVAVEMPAEETVVDMEYPSLSRIPQSASVQTPVKPGANTGRRKILPHDAKSPQPGSVVRQGTNGSESTSQSNVPPTNVNSSSSSGPRGQGPSASSRKKKIMVLPGQVNIHAGEGGRSSDSSVRHHNHSSTDSDGLSPWRHKGVEQSPLPDSAFSPASRPETPCWDFYDFAEDLQPEDDVEAIGRSLEESLAQLRQEGIGSLQNLSKEPILPMDLKDDFDSLAVDPEPVEQSD